ncbi:hypothetical protein N657DRAFT_692886 [Parathielavia appendiculata]|uniref:Uncharacterized protein n=1 Tax=Parathielavia appendiculata TaxID=2587402 RepID=A0AAN6TVF7_9PEZI|nr:hypothetical protein N657DRAFT_692886 [Parathielavia appendiculata]
MTHNKGAKIKVPAPDRWQYPGMVSQEDDPYITWELRHPGTENYVGVTPPEFINELSQTLWEHSTPEDSRVDGNTRITQIPAAKSSRADGYPFNYMIPTAWNKGTAWFVRGVSNDDKAPIYLMTAAHNLVKQVSRKIDAWGRPLDRSAISQGLTWPPEKPWPDRGLSFPPINKKFALKTWPYKGMLKGRARADAVLIVSERRETFLKDPHGHRLDIAALRLHKAFPGDFPSDVLSAAPYIHSLPLGFKTHSNAFFMGVGILGSLDKFIEKGGVYILRDPAHRNQHAAETNAMTVFDFRSWGTIELPEWPGYRPSLPGLGYVQPYTSEGVEIFNGTLVHRLPNKRMRPGVSNGPGIWGLVLKNGEGEVVDKLEMAVCCMVIEDEDPVEQGSYKSGGAIFSSTAMAPGPNIKAADPAVLLRQLGAEDLKWQSVTFGDHQLCNYPGSSLNR